MGQNNRGENASNSNSNSKSSSRSRFRSNEDTTFLDCSQKAEGGSGATAEATINPPDFFDVVDLKKAGSGTAGRARRRASAVAKELLKEGNFPEAPKNGKLPSGLVKRVGQLLARYDEQTLHDVIKKTRGHKFYGTMGIMTLLGDVNFGDILNMDNKVDGDSGHKRYSGVEVEVWKDYWCSVESVHTKHPDFVATSDTVFRKFIRREGAAEIFEKFRVDLNTKKVLEKWEWENPIRYI